MDLEFGWDGGITDQNVAVLVNGGVDVLNVGGFIHGCLVFRVEVTLVTETGKDRRW